MDAMRTQGAARDEAERDSPQKFIGRGDARPRDVCAPLPGGAAPRPGRRSPAMAPSSVARIKDTVFHAEVYEPAEVSRAARPASLASPVGTSTAAPLLPALTHPPPATPLRVRVPQDSFLLVDVLAEEWRTRLSLDPPSVVVEVGSGTGYVIASAALLHVASCGAASARPASASFYATDVNPDAVASTRATLAAHGVLSRDDDDDPSSSAAGGIRTHCLRCDLLGPLRSDLAGRVDLLLFNPPYVLTPSEEVGSASIAAAWAGGPTGARSSTVCYRTWALCWPRGDVPAPPARAEQARGREADPRGAGARGDGAGGGEKRRRGAPVRAEGGEAEGSRL